jgi:hypothetical protein
MPATEHPEAKIGKALLTFRQGFFTAETGGPANQEEILLRW